MKSLKELLFNPAQFYRKINKNKASVVKAVLIGMLGLIIPGILSSIIFSFIMENEFQMIMGEECILYLIMGIGLIVTSAAVILFKGFVCWLILRLLRTQHTFKNIVIFIGYSVIASIWNFIPMVGFICVLLHIFFITFKGSIEFFGITKRQGFIMGIILSIINFVPQPFFFMTF